MGRMAKHNGARGRRPVKLRMDEVVEQSGLDSAAMPLPAGLRCPRCWYDLSNSRVWVCSECGWNITGADFSVMQARADVRRLLRRLLRTRLLVCVGVAGLSTLAALIVLGVWELAVLVALLMSAATFGSVGGGLLGARATRPDERASWSVFWLRECWWLHLPGLTAVAGVFAAYAADQRFPARRAFEFQLICEVVVLAMAVVGTVVFTTRWRRCVRRYRLRDRTAKVYFPLVAFWVIVLSPVLLAGSAIALLPS